ncbi:MAG: translation elongation factor-like protein [Candidatus Eisenbacteria bacterium]|nr:translation elongation factor-like protein [Candidatus Eisenbacteria bacterium]
MEKKEIGRVSHYFGGPGVAAIVLTEELSTGDRISVEGHTTDFELVVGSMQVEHEQIDQAKAGDNVGIKVPQRVRENDVVYKIIE